MWLVLDNHCYTNSFMNLSVDRILYLNRLTRKQSASKDSPTTLTKAKTESKMRRTRGASRAQISLLQKAKRKTLLGMFHQRPNFFAKSKISATSSIF